MSETVQLYKCDACQKIITDPKDGIVVHGNIYVADPTQRGGLIGNNFPTDVDDVKFESVEDAVEESVYCKGCFLKAVFPEINLSRDSGLF